MLKSKPPRTRIGDLAPVKVDLLPTELNLVSGGAKARGTKERTNVATGHSWDDDSQWDYSPGD